MVFFRTLLIYSIIAMIIALFFIKIKMQNLSQELKNIELSIQNEKENIHILKAELTYLSKPQQIESLAARYLDLQLIKPDQIVSIKNSRTSQNEPINRSR